jgi:hypothetical protein
MWHTPQFPGRILVSPRDRGPIGSRRWSHRRRSAVFRLEALEGRALLSTVTSLLDDGTPGTLRQTIANAPAGDTITFDSTLFSSGLPQTITLNQSPGYGELNITENLDIEGPGADLLTISGNDASRVFYIQSGTVTIAGLTVAHGLSKGLPANDNPLSGSAGGGIVNFANLTLSNDVLSENRVVGSVYSAAASFPGGALGGGIYNLGTLSVDLCQFNNNQALADTGYLGGHAGFAGGGGIANGPNATATISDSWLDGNVAQGSNGNIGGFCGVGYGGGISSSGKLTVIGSMFTANQAIGGNDNKGTGIGLGDYGIGAGVGGAIGTGSARGAAQTLTVRASTFDHNQAVGGNGNYVKSINIPPTFAPNAGAAGAILVLRGLATISDSTFGHNQAVGGQGAGGSPGGTGAGGALFAAGAVFPVSVGVSGCTVGHNSAIGAPGSFGGDGGIGVGGGMANILGAQLSISSTTVDHNKAVGGDGGAGGNGGNGNGGGLYNDASSTLTLTGATVQYNLALGGEAGSGGSDGEGIGGGVYLLGTFTIDPTTVITKNHASTSNHDIGP